LETNQKLDQRTRIAMESAYANGQSATNLSDLIQQVPSLSTHSSMKVDLEALVEKGIGPTINVCRNWVAQVAQQQMMQHSHDEWASSMHLYRPEHEVAVGEESYEEFDIVCPVMWKVVPSPEDEEAAQHNQEEPTPKPELPSDIMEWEMSSAFDTHSLNFESFYTNAWACDAMFNLLKENLDITKKFMISWLTYPARNSADSTLVGPKAAKALKFTTTFAEAFLAVVGDKPLTEEGHTAFTVVFVVTKGKGIVPFYKTMAAACRRNPKWAKFENRTIRNAAKELEHGPAFWQAFCSLDSKEDITDQDVDRMVEQVPQWQVCIRKSAYHGFEDLLRTWLLQRVAVLVSPEYQTYPKDRIQSLRNISAHMQLLDDTEPLMAKMLSEARALADDTVRGLQSTLAR